MARRPATIDQRTWTLAAGAGHLDKRAFYSRHDVARAYDRQRFGGPSGARVNKRELQLVEELLPPTGRVLDLACGTGRLTHRLAARGYRVVAADSSAVMLRALRADDRRPPSPPPSPKGRGGLGVGGRGPQPVSSVVVADAFHLPFADGAFEAAVAMRLLFHYADVGPIVQEMARVCRPGGVVVFDTASWSPRSTVALAAGRWGGKVFVHPPAALAARLAQLGLEVSARRSAFLVSPYLYRLLPLGLEQLLERLETKLPEAWRSRIIWQVRVKAGEVATGVVG